MTSHKMAAEIVAIQNLNFSYPDGTRALRGINFKVSKGESLGMVGPNGSGKTTLLLHLNGILKGHGKVMIAGRPICESNLSFIRQRVGLVFQDPDDQLFCPSVYEDVAFGLLNMRFPKELIDQRVKSSLAQIGMSGFEDRCAHHLSFGEKKRVCLATVLALSPQILALDEPSSNLDQTSRRKFIQILKALDLIKIVATHDLELVLEVCSRVVVLNKGMVVTEGQTITVLSDKELMENNGLEIPLSLKYKELAQRVPSPLS